MIHFRTPSHAVACDKRIKWGTPIQGDVTCPRCLHWLENNSVSLPRLKYEAHHVPHPLDPELADLAAGAYEALRLLIDYLAEDDSPGPGEDDILDDLERVKAKVYLMEFDNRPAM